MNGTRSKLVLLAVVLALGAYVPACCCWVETIAAWAMGAGAGGSGGEAAHSCCDHRHHGGSGDHSTSDDGDDGDDGGGSPDGGWPQHVTECGCGVQHRIAVQADPTALDFAPAVLAWVTLPLDLGLSQWGIPAGWVRAERASACADGGGRALLRLHCALTI